MLVSLFLRHHCNPSSYFLFPRYCRKLQAANNKRQSKKPEKQYSNSVRCLLDDMFAMATARMTGFVMASPCTTLLETKRYQTAHAEMMRE